MQLLRATPPRLKLDFVIAMVCLFGDFLGDNLLAPGYELFIRENGVPGKSSRNSTTVNLLRLVRYGLWPRRLDLERIVHSGKMLRLSHHGAYI